MPASRPLPSLRTTLLVDAAACLACGALMALATEHLASATRIPPSLLLYAGLSLFPIALLMAVVGTRAAHSPPAVALVAGGNLLWVAASVWLLVSDAIAPSPLGVAFIAVQAAVVAALAALELRGALSLRGARTATA